MGSFMMPDSYYEPREAPVCDFCGKTGHTKYQCEETEHGGDGDDD